jgi:hypothetical protein
MSQIPAIEPDRAFNVIVGNIQYYLESGDKRAVLGSHLRPFFEVVHRVWVELPPDENNEAKVGTSYLLAWWHYCRFLELPPQDEMADREIAFTLFGYFYRRDPLSLPGDLRPIFAARSGVRDGPEPPNPAALSRAGAVRMGAYIADRRPEDLDHAVGLFAAAVEHVSEEHPIRGMYLGNLGTALRLRAEASADVADLRIWLACQEECVVRTSRDNVHVVRRLEQLVTGLYQLFQETSEPQPLHDAMTFARVLVPVAEYHNIAGGSTALLLGTLLVQRCRIDYSGELIDETITTLSQVATTAGPSDADRREALSLLSIALLLRFDHAAEISDLDQAVTHAQAAVDGTGPHDPTTGRYLTHLGNALHTRYERRGDIDDLDRALAARRAAAATIEAPDDSCGR